MQPIVYPERENWASLLARPMMNAASLFDIVHPILHRIREEKDDALIDFTQRFDGVKLDSLRVGEAEFEAARSLVPKSLKAAIRQAKANIMAFHEAQHEPLVEVETMAGVRCWRKSVAIQKVGLYIPGGTAPLFSTILMLGVPAVVAGCKEIVMCSPPDKNGQIHPAMLYTAELLGIKTFIKAGGAQAIAAMAYGTESVPGVFKIFGPGNQYVTAAKQLVSQEGIAIDMPAGPSELAVVADASANPDFVAADLLSQAEHGTDSQVLLVTTHEPLLEQVQQSVGKQLEVLPRKEIAAKALANSRMILLKNQEEVVEMINAYAPEHLILAVADDEFLAAQITDAGSVFLGHYTPESAGDYASGTNHTLPTNGHARAYSGVSLDSFVKKITFQKLTPEGIRNLGPTVEVMADGEELTAHERAVSVRLQYLG
ncbi:MAG: histidinol dehydrogenase [Bacteroidota bacterium]